MRKSKLMMTVGAFILAVGGVFASITLAPPVNADARHPLTNNCVPDQTVEQDCNPSLTEGIQCTVSFNGTTRDAWKPETAQPCAEPLFRPAN
ncbi:DUF6520 family protein [Sinomicrobium kalidii]|uniref:DUF6520 family protein n=1 Tax=Sinomicrobium kalidii TaxID=2900738 RepID=UPI001E47D674|nr:DUF6520 family protein [Sinomicrobium kalidii]UGU15401.1 DUF6520 family protein [Sinomicrobium kalidii]